MLTQLSAGSAWVSVTVAAAVAAGMAALVWRFTKWQSPRWMRMLQLLYVIVLLGSLLNEVANSWPTGHPKAVPLLLMGLAVWSVSKGVSAAARVGVVLFWVVLLIYLAVLGAGVGEVRLQWLKPELGYVNPVSLALLLLPAGAIALMRKKQQWSGKVFLPYLFSLTAAVVIVGVISPQVAIGMDQSFYEYSRSLSLLGVVKRLEAVASAGMTLGWFALLTIILSMCAVQTEEIFSKGRRASVVIVAVLGALWLLCGLHIPQWILPAGAAVFWVLLPLVTQEIVKRKK